MAWINDLDTSTPSGSDPPAVLDNRIREAKAAIVERLAQDHYMPLTGTSQTDTAGGEHVKVTLRETTKPAAVTDKGFLYVKDVSGTTELFFEDAAGNEKQLMSAGQINVALTDIPDDVITGAKILLLNNTYLRAKDVAGTGTVDLIKANSSDKPVVPDGIQTATDTAPTLDAEVTNKKYVDDQIDTRRLGALQATDSNGNAFLNVTTYLAQSDGEVIWMTQVNSNADIGGYVGTSSPPTTRIEYTYNSGLSARWDGKHFHVAEGEYWKITQTGSSPSAIYWRPSGTGQCVKQ
jgi:hypothetical protein